MSNFLLENLISAMSFNILLMSSPRICSLYWRVFFFLNGSFEAYASSEPTIIFHFLSFTHLFPAAVFPPCNYPPCPFLRTSSSALLQLSTSASGGRDREVCLSRSEPLCLSLTTPPFDMDGQRDRALSLLGCCQ